MKFLIEKGVEATYSDILNQTVLYYAAREGKTDCIDMLIQLGCNVNHRDTYGQTPIYYSAREGHYELTSKLIEHGADVNNEDMNGQTPLFYSAREGHKAISELLIKNGAIPNKKDKKRQTPMYWARKGNKTEVIDLLASHGGAPKENIKKARPMKKESKKKVLETNEVKKYVLTICKHGERRETAPEEFKAFIENNKELAVYFTDPNTVKNMRMPEVEDSAVIFDHWDKAAKRIIAHLWKASGAINFQTPVDIVALQIPDYFNIIKKPMDLGTIKRKLAGCEYEKCKDFVNDVELVFNNAITYNGENSYYGKLGRRMLNEFENQCKALNLDYYM